MAADQRKRRPTTAPFGCGSQEQYRAKKREFRSLQYEFNCNGHVSLKWDDDEKMVIAKEEQIGISSRHLAPFGPVSSDKLADVITVPKEVFELDDLSEVLTYEAWQSLLTEKDRSFLAQFLPHGFESDEIVEALLGGENFHFGNHFLKWGSSLCSGGFHPDTVGQYEKTFKANKKAYYSELQQYHDNMIRNLQNLKERCGSSKDPHSEILKIVSRSKGHAEKNVLPDTNGFRSQKLELSAPFESPSSIADDKSYYSDNQKLSVIRDAEIQRRVRNQELIKDKHEKFSPSPNGPKVLPRPKKAEKSQKSNISSNDGTKYMSYVKISKKQHDELVMSMGQPGSSIPSKNLNRLLGNIESFNVKPYEMFEEEEQKRIHEHWANMVSKDLPVALQKWRKGQLERLQIMNYLCEEIEDKLGLSEETENGKLVKPFNEGIPDARDVVGEDFQGTSKDLNDDKSASQDSLSDGDNSSASSSQSESSKQSAPLNINEDFDLSSLQKPSSNVNKEFDPSSTESQPLQDPLLNVNEKFDPSSIANQSWRNSVLNVKEKSGSSPTVNKSLLNSPPSNNNQEFTPMDLNAVNNQVSSKRSDTCSPPEHVVQTSEASLGVSHTEIHGSASADNVVELPGSSVKNMWSSIGLPASYGLSHLTTRYGSSSELAVRPPQLAPHQPAQLIDLESDLPGGTPPQLAPHQPAQLIDLESDLPGGTTKDLLNRHTDHLQFVSPYAPRDRNELLLQSLIKRDSYHQEQKRSGLAFHQSLEPNQFPNHIQEQLQPSFAVDHRQRVQNELFINHNIQDSIYSDNSRYPVPGHEHFSALNMRDWGGPRISTPIQPQLSSGGQLNHGLFANDTRAHGGWSAPESTVFQTPSLGSSDQSLYSVLTQCNSLRPGPRPHYSPVGPVEQMMIPSTSYGQEMATGIPLTSNPLSQTTSPFDYLGGGEASTTLKNPLMGWMSLGHQPPGLHDPSGKPFLRPWNP